MFPPAVCEFRCPTSLLTLGTLTATSKRIPNAIMPPLCGNLPGTPALDRTQPACPGAVYEPGSQHRRIFHHRAPFSVPARGSPPSAAQSLLGPSQEQLPGPTLGLYTSISSSCRCYGLNRGHPPPENNSSVELLTPSTLAREWIWIGSFKR